MAEPTVRIESPSLKTSSSSSVRYDHSGAAERRRRQDAISEMVSKRFESLYAGDIPSAIAAGRRIRALKRSLDGIDDVKVEALSGESSSEIGQASREQAAIKPAAPKSRDGEAVGGDSESPKPPKPESSTPPKGEQPKAPKK